MNIPIDKILPNPEQPRKNFDAVELQGLSQSILENGVIQPIVVEEAGECYILHDGERRVRAAKMAGLKEIPAAIVPGLNGTAKLDRLTRALVANIQRADLSPIEEAQGYQVLSNLGMTNNGIALKFGISSARVANWLSLLKFEKPIQHLIEDGRLSMDPRMVAALNDLPSGEVRVKTAKTLADRHASIKAGVEACARVAETLRAVNIPADEVPSLRLARKKNGDANRPVWDALVQVGKLPPWLLVEISARNVCDNCALRDVASATTCRGCALVEMLVELIGSTKNTQAGAKR